MVKKTKPSANLPGKKFIEWRLLSWNLVDFWDLIHGWTHHINVKSWITGLQYRRDSLKLSSNFRHVQSRSDGCVWSVDLKVQDLKCIWSSYHLQLWCITGFDDAPQSKVGVTFNDGKPMNKKSPVSGHCAFAIAGFGVIFTVGLIFLQC